MRTITLKQSGYSNMPNLPYPNSATRRELLHRFLNFLLVAAMGAGAAASLLFILALA